MKNRNISQIAILIVISLIAYNLKEKKAEVDPKESVPPYHNGDIITIEGDAANYAEAIVEKDGKIVFLGVRSPSVRKRTLSTSLGYKVLHFGIV